MYTYYVVQVWSALHTHRENRYLLFLTENYAALEILKQYLQDHEEEPSSSPGSDELSEDRDESTLKPWEMEPFILFGSSFPKDKEYTQVRCGLSFQLLFALLDPVSHSYAHTHNVQVCRNINQIKICMETGRTVILLNLENLYESLYDVFNQVSTLYSILSWHCICSTNFFIFLLTSVTSTMVVAGMQT